jgi:hypothetical protein
VCHATRLDHVLLSSGQFGAGEVGAQAAPPDAQPAFEGLLGLGHHPPIFQPDGRELILSTAEYPESIWIPIQFTALPVGRRTAPGRATVPSAAHRSSPGSFLPLPALPPV